MQKSQAIILALVIVVFEFIGFYFYDINRVPDVPGYGEWYCEELKIGIEFDIYRNAEAKRYMDDGSYEVLDIYWPMDWSSYEIGEHDGLTYNCIIYGERFWHKNIFVIRNVSDGQIYKFVLVEE